MEVGWKYISDMLKIVLLDKDYFIFSLIQNTEEPYETLMIGLLLKHCLKFLEILSQSFLTERFRNIRKLHIGPPEPDRGPERLGGTPLPLLHSIPQMGGNPSAAGKSPDYQIRRPPPATEAAGGG
jgi:hypothetical protein